MSWTKIDETHYVRVTKPVSQEIVDIVELKREIEELQEEINILQKNMLQYPKEADERLKQAIDMWNELNIHHVLQLKESQLTEKLHMLGKIQNG